MTTNELLINDLWWFIENSTDDMPDRTDRFFRLRERVRECGQRERERLDAARIHRHAIRANAQ